MHNTVDNYIEKYQIGGRDFIFLARLLLYEKRLDSPGVDVLLVVLKRLVLF